MDTSWRKNYLRYKSFFLNMLTQYRERSDWKAYLEILLSLVTISVFSIFALRPTILTIAELIRQIEEKKSTVAKMDDKIQTIVRAQTLYDRETPNIILLTTLTIPDKAQSDIFARQIEGLSSRYQIVLNRVSIGKASILGRKIPDEQETQSGIIQKPGIEEIKYSITLVANVNQYQSVSNFLKDFENLKTLSKIETLNLGVKEESESKQKSLVLLLEGTLPYLGGLITK